jgi:hypothetical protein
VASWTPRDDLRAPTLRELRRQLWFTDRPGRRRRGGILSVLLAHRLARKLAKEEQGANRPRANS